MSPTVQTNVKVEFDPKNMPFRRLGPSGLRVPVFAFGGWLTLGQSVRGTRTKELMKVAFENGINMFDTAEAYNNGESEIDMHVAPAFICDFRVLTMIRTVGEMPLRNLDIVVPTSFIIEGTQESLARLGLDYVDVIFAHRPDHSVPMEEIVRAFNFVIEQGWSFYWATSEWSAEDIEEAFHVATKLNLMGPIAEQCQHHMFHRERPEKEYAKIYRKYAIGTTVWSALASGLLTGKYNDGIPEGSRFDIEKNFFSNTIEGLQSAEGKEKIRKVRELTKLAKEELDTTPAVLALAWVARNPNTSTVILGATKPEQILENLKAIEVMKKLTPEILEKIEEILGNKPDALPTFGRPPLDLLGRL
ncbi:hypothetical protein D9758_018076 [Tetrapyrgos nigripes]|uniref:NADP-dependent oxidoreductase domain-containing protein n=1 Tax=Tetrapyrgos nigripes TaxID=182062 RepID=A0A8H5FF40_9AGAR|nr:hypothetical protein D9758_018076 [Tetrapyrgos nigripes]